MLVGLRMIAAVGLVVALAAAGCFGGPAGGTGTSTTTTGPPPRDPTPAGEEADGAVSGFDVWGVGAIDGPTSDTSRVPPDFAAEVRGFDPTAFEPGLLSPDPGDRPNPDWPLIVSPVGPGPDPPFHFDPDIALPAGPCPRPPFDAGAFQVFDDAMAGIMDDESILTANLAVSDQCGLLYEKGYGILGPRPWAPSWSSPVNLNAYLDHVYEPNTPDTMWRIASLTKPVTSAVIHSMVDDGLIGYDDIVFCPSAAQTTSPNAPPGGKCLLNYDPATGPGTVFSTVTQLKQTATVEHLLQHNGGWDRDGSRNGDFMFMPMTVNDAVGGTLPPDEHDLAQWGLSQPIWFAPGNQGAALDAYSNFGFMLLGLIVEKWGEKSYLEYLRQDIIGPLGVPAADIQRGRSLPDDFDPREPYYPCGGTRSSPFPGQTPEPVCFMYGGMVMEPQLAHGSLVTTADALARFMSDYWVDSFFDEEKGLPRNAYMTFPDGQRGYHNGIYGGVRSIMLQCLNGLNFAFLSNAAKNIDWTAATAAFCDAGDDFYDAGPFHSLVYVPTGDVTWAYRHARNGAEHQTVFESLSGAGYFLDDISCYDLGGVAHFTSAWVHRPSGPGWAATHGVTTATMQTTMDTWDADGLRVVTLSACNVAGSIRWNAVAISEPGGPDWVAHPGLDGSAYQTKFNELANDGYRLVDITAYDEGGVAKYAAAWVRQSAGATGGRTGGTTGPLAPAIAWAASHGATVADLQAAEVAHHEAAVPLHLADLSVVETAAGLRYAALWTDELADPPSYWTAMPWWDTSGFLQSQQDAGRRLISLDAT